MLDPKQIDNLPFGGMLKDPDIRGLSVHRHKSGWSWLLYYRNRAGQQRRPKLGPYPLLSPANARKLAKDTLVKVLMGEDPSGERKRVLRDLTLNQLWFRCKAEHWNRNKAWDKEATRLYRVRIGPILGGNKLSEIGAAEIVALQERLKDRPTQANRVMAVLAKMLALAERWSLRPIGSNPCRVAQHFEERKRKRFATPGEIKRIGQAMAALGEIEGMAFLYLMFFTGARPTELLRATPDMVKDKVLVIAEGKTGQRRIHLSSRATEVLDRLPAGRRWLCGTQRMPRMLWKQICDLAGIEGLWIRDLRRTFATVGFSHGFGIEQVGELLGHQCAQTTMTYAKLLDHSEVAMSAAIADQVGAMLSPGPAVQP